MNLIDFEGRKVPATYLGDAVYVIYDGYNYWLRLNDHRNEEGQICLEPPVIDSLIIFMADCTKAKRDERKESKNLANTNNKQEG